MAILSDSIYFEFLNTGKYSDLTIECQGAEFKVHRMVVCPQSAMLDKACSGPFEEASSGVVKFPEEESSIMARVILFMYTKDYEDNRLPWFYKQVIHDDDEDEEERLRGQPGRDIDELGMMRPLKVNALMYKCADMLGLEQLKEIASSRFMRDARLAYEMDGFDDVLQLLYENTSPGDRGLRFDVTRLCVENHDLLEIRKKTVEVIEEHQPDVWTFTVELLKRWARDSASGGALEETIKLYKLVKQVSKCNEKQCLTGCGHTALVSQMRLKLEGGELSIICPVCIP
ncbi:hypothetical protein LTR10_019832 [Elasticomyces elasticus]|uniref:BTB domain-containing protein n=1 Tax=Exophiala sideris TaxID=1016849 RepID=A0ABR0J190_9EURO|nr:hypothetical protein LTR10_019832 [Elasticomyces elasticus]KAK5024416.1 hypothetical protein LTS07_008707 [Exophiala sideris]KAK5030902.1 hypothetical protein LTR13_007915 [Exophiala sideris]KAK5054149.1 hypothetical protein LTR69_009111 [Exophiala sideris]KAK5179495.1 hypothetical protein LTR44_008011 [Eurotiomycetes sp. CCFEE 6388]